MKLYRKKAFTYAEPIDIGNLDNLELMGAVISDYHERSVDAFEKHAKVGDCVIWVKRNRVLGDTISSAMCKTIEGIHVAKLPSRLMKQNDDETPYFCTEDVFQKTYEYSGQRRPINQDDFNDYDHQGSY